MFEVVKNALAVKVAAETPKLSAQDECARRADELFAQQQDEIYRNTDQLFARLMIFQWVAAVLMAVVISPYAWNGESRAIHIHVWAAIFLGGAISIFPIWLTRAWPGAAITRHVIAVAQMLMSALLISVTGGRIETHFHVFGSLVILSFYRDWRVLIPATIVVALDHFIRGVYWPYSVYGILTASPLRSVEHAAWVVFEDVFLVISCLRSIGEMRSIANRTAALEASEKNFREIFEGAPIGVAVADFDYRFLQVNRALCEMTGYSAEELKQRKTLDITFPEDVDLTTQIARAMLEGRSRDSFEKRYVRKNKEVFWVACTISLVCDENGKPVQFLGMVQDISERKRAEEEIQQLNQVLEQRVQERTAELQTANCQLQNDIIERKRAEEESRLLQTIALAIGEAEDLDAALEMVLRNVCEVTGWILGQAWTPRVAESVLEFSAAWCNDGAGAEKFRTASEGFTFPPGVGLPGRVWASKQPAWIRDVRVDTNFPRAKAAREAGFKAGMAIPVIAGEEVVAVVEFFVRESREEDERFVKLISSVMPQLGQIVQRKRTEDALHETNLALGNAMPGISILNSEGRYERVNEAYAQMLGYSLGELVGMNWRPAVVPEDRKHGLDAYQRMLSEGKAEFEARAMRKDGSLFYKHVLMVKRTDANGKLLGHYCFMRDITERKRVEQVLKQSEEQYRLIAENMTDTVWVRDLNLNLTYVSPSAARARDYSVEELKALPLDRHLTPGSLDLVVRSLKEELAAENSPHVDRNRIKTLELEYYRKDGSTYCSETKLTFLRDSDGNPTAILGVGRDISERKQAEEALRQAEQKYRAIFENATEGIFQTTPDGKYLSVNRAMARLFGYDSPEDLKTTVTDIGSEFYVDPERRNEFKRLIEEQGSVERFEYQVRRKDGRTMWLTEDARAVRDANGAVIYYEGAMRDITERKEAEDALRQTEQKYRAIFENAIEGIFQTTPDGKYVSVNPALAQMYGYASPEELMAVADIGETIYVDPERRLEFKRAIEKQGFVELFEYEVNRKDGSKIWLCENARAVRNEDGAVIYYEGSVEDITEQKRVKEVERASKAKSEFLSRMSHELRTPLNAILGFGQLLDRQKPTAVQKNRITHILNAGRHLLNLINEVLDIARVESGRFHLSLEPVLVEQAVDEAIDLIRPMATDRKIEINRTPLLEASPSILADRQRVKQVLLNLLSNAVKYNREAGRIIVDLVPQPQERFRISVSDEGAGIPRDKRARLFSPFDRLGAENSDTQGTGLGLALSKRLTEAMGGTIGEGGPAMGACFWIEFPLVKGVVEQVASDRVSSTGLAKLNGESKTLLYIEDNLSNLTLVEHLLRECAPIKLISAMQGQLGLEWAARYQPDLILLDVHLPDINGAEVLARLKANARTRNIPVVVLSADATKTQITRLMSLGATDYLTKPLDVDCFLKVIEEHFCEPAVTSTNGNGA